MEFIIAIGVIATIIFLVKNNISHPGRSEKRSRQLGDAKKSNRQSNPWASGHAQPRTLRDLLPKGFLEQSGDKILDFTKPRKSDHIEDYSEIYTLEKSILTPAELKFMRVLQEVIGDKYYILSKVRVADVFKVKKQNYGEAEYRWFNKIKAKHFDYILCCPNTFKPIIIVELDDSTHNLPNRQKRDVFVNKVCRDNGIKIIRQSVKRKYDFDEVNKLVNGN